ncbi:MAG: hypothetical protein MJA29_05550, partial [Candidatus Omnitrophica bacterium]|nr:hypothetical protein [Candidatus Omnitrophota bacterium]
AWMAYREAVDRMREYEHKLDHIYQKQLPAILPGFQAEHLRPMSDYYSEEEMQNWIISRTKRQVTILDHTKDKGRKTYKIREDESEMETTTPSTRRTTFGFTSDQPNQLAIQDLVVYKMQNNTIVSKPPPTTKVTLLQGTDEKLKIDSKLVQLQVNETHYFEGKPFEEQGQKQKKNRRKRQIFDLLSLGIQGFQAFEQAQTNSKIKPGMKILARKQNFDHKKIMHLEEDLMSLSRATLKEIKNLGKQLHMTGAHIRHLARQIKQLTVELNKAGQRVQDNSNAIMILSSAFSTLFTQVERYLTLYQRIENRMDTLLDALDNLSNNLLSHSVISSDILFELIESVKQYLLEYKPGYELVLTEVHQYYNLPTITFAYENGVLGIQIPLFVKPKLQESLHLFHLKTIPVPYHINPDLRSENESVYTYTRLIPSANLLAMSSDTYINLSTEDLANCLKVSHVYFCERLFLIKHHTEHTCESAIYHKQSPSIIKEKCDIRYYPHLNPNPEILDDGNHLLLGNLPKPWTVLCEHEDQIPNPLKGDPYVIIKKSDLCGCAISAGKWYIEENIIHCNSDKDTEIQLFYPINMAVMIYQFIEKMKEDGITDMTLYKEQIKFDPVEPFIVSQTEADILEEIMQPVGLVLQEAMQNVEERRYATKEDYALAMFDMKNWFSNKSPNYILGFMVIASFLTVIVTIGLVYLAMKVFGLKIKFGRMNGHLAKIMMGSMLKLPISEARKLNHATTSIVLDNTILMSVILKLTGILLSIWLLYKILKYLRQYFGIHYLDTTNSKLSVFQNLISDKTDIYMQLTQTFGRVTSMIYLGTIFGNPEDILAKENILKFDDIKLHKNWRYDYLQVLWHRYKFELRGLSLNLPMDITIPLWKRHHVRQIYKRYNSMYKIIAYNPNTFKVRSLTTYNWITVQQQNQNDEMRTTTILEPTTTSLSKAAASDEASNESADESDTMMH